MPLYGGLAFCEYPIIKVISAKAVTNTATEILSRDVDFLDFIDVEPRPDLEHEASPGPLGLGRRRRERAKRKTETRTPSKSGSGVEN